MEPTTPPLFKKTIALAHFRVGDIDGVSLEMDKCRKVLEKLGHSTLYIAGSGGTKNPKIIEGLRYDHSRNHLIVKNAYEKLSGFYSTKSLEREIYAYASEIEKELIAIIKKQHIDILVPHNIFSLGWNLSAAIAFYNACIKTNTRVICHHHDFSWERLKYAKPTCLFIIQILQKYFPPRHPLFEHIVINRIAQKELLKRRSIESTVVPNVFDFEAETWKIDDYNKDFRKEMGVTDNDILILQATRIVERKAIELAIDFVAEMNLEKENIIGKKLYNGQEFRKNSNIYLVFTNLNEANVYYQKLMEYAIQKKVKILNFNYRINHQRKQSGNTKIYSLWDAYVFADMVTYPSILEGWGNQFLEALFAQKPIVVYEYPVYKADIKPLGFRVISLGDEHQKSPTGFFQISKKKIQRAVQESLPYLFNKAYRKKRMKENFKLAGQNLSYNSLHRQFQSIF